MNNIYFSSCNCVAITIPGKPCTRVDASSVQRLREWFATLARAMQRDAREHAISRAYRDLPAHARVDLGIDRRRA